MFREEPKYQDPIVPKIQELIVPNDQDPTVPKLEYIIVPKDQVPIVPNNQNLIVPNNQDLMALNNYRGDDGDVDKNNIFEVKIGFDGKGVAVLPEVNGEEIEETLIKL